MYSLIIQDIFLSKYSNIVVALPIANLNAEFIADMI